MIIVIEKKNQKKEQWMNKNNTYLLLFDCNLKYIIRNVEILYKKKKKNIIIKIIVKAHYLISNIFCYC